MIGPSVHTSVLPVRKKWLSPYFNTYWCYIHQTCTYCSSWHDLFIPRGGLCPWPTFHAWVTVVRKKWLSPYYSTYWCYIHKTCTNCSSWHDLLIPCGGLCPWPTFHTSVTKTLNGNSGAPVMGPITIMSSMPLYLCHDVIFTWGILVVNTLSWKTRNLSPRENFHFALHLPNLHQLFILTWSTDATWWFVSLTYISRFSDQDTKWQ